MNKETNFDKFMMAFGEKVANELTPIFAELSAIGVAAAYEVESFICAIQPYVTRTLVDLDVTCTLNHPERYEYESLTNWGNRLERAGLLDKYEYRLMYGAECWRAVLHSPIWYAGEVWWWLCNVSEWAWLDVKEYVRGLWTKN